MLITFQSRAYPNITLFGNVALQLIRLMGHSGSVPGAILAENVPEALMRLRTAIAAGGAAPAMPGRDRAHWSSTVNGASDCIQCICIFAVPLQQ
jgi:hypothetical protein